MDQDDEDLITAFHSQCSSILWRNTAVESGADTSAAMTAREVSVNCSDRISGDSISDRISTATSSSSRRRSSSNHYSDNSEETFTSIEHLFAFAKPNTNAPIFDIISRLFDKLKQNGETFNPEGYLVKEGQLTAPTNTGRALLYLLLCRLKNEIEIEKRKVGGTTEFSKRQGFYIRDKKYKNKDLKFFVISNYDTYIVSFLICYSNACRKFTHIFVHLTIVLKELQQ
jgi:hypothetical protein